MTQRQMWTTRAKRWALGLALGLISMACTTDETAPSSPYASDPRTGEMPDVVVVMDETDYDLIPKEINKVAVNFNDAHQDNDREPLVIPPGKTRFFLTNRGKVTHNLHVGGSGIDQKTRNIGIQRIATLELELTEGTYQISCLIGDHPERGMKRPLIVTRDARDKYPRPTPGETTN